MSIVLVGSTSGSVTLQEPAVAGSTTLTLPATTGTVVVGSSAVSAAGQIPFSTDGSTYTPTAKIVSGTAVASTSGTSIDFTGIPSWVKRITVMFQGVSTNGSSVHIMRLGTSGGFVTSGYASGGIYTGISTSGGTRTDGLLLDGNATDSAVILHGHAILTNISGNSWVQSFVMGQSNSGYAVMGGGSITLSGALTQIRITMVNGTDAFDAGTINIFYE